MEDLSQFRIRLNSFCSYRKMKSVFITYAKVGAINNINFSCLSYIPQLHLLFDMILINVQTGNRQDHQLCGNQCPPVFHVGFVLSLFSKTRASFIDPDQPLLTEVNLRLLVQVAWRLTAQNLLRHVLAAKGFSGCTILIMCRQPDLQCKYGIEFLSANITWFHH